MLSICVLVISFQCPTEQKVLSVYGYSYVYGIRRFYNPSLTWNIPVHLLVQSFENLAQLVELLV